MKRMQAALVLFIVLATFVHVAGAKRQPPILVDRDWVQPSILARYHPSGFLHLPVARMIIDSSELLVSGVSGKFVRTPVDAVGDRLKIALNANTGTKGVRWVLLRANKSLAYPSDATAALTGLAKFPVYLALALEVPGSPSDDYVQKIKSALADSKPKEDAEEEKEEEKKREPFFETRVRIDEGDKEGGDPLRRWQIKDDVSDAPGEAYGSIIPVSTILFRMQRVNFGSDEVTREIVSMDLEAIETAR